MAPEMQPTPESSNVREIGYDEAFEELWVVFDRATYVYSNVSPAVWAEFQYAPSKGRYVNEVLKPGYPCRRE